MTLRSLLLVLALAVVGWGAGGCSTFSRDARAVRARPTSPDTPEGLWKGTWQDARRPAHGGSLEIVMTRTGDQLYRLASRSHWWKVFRSSIDTTVVVIPVAPGHHLVSGSESIWAFGDYSISGRIDDGTFTGTYEAAGHRGRISLQRVSQ